MTRPPLERYVRLTLDCSNVTVEPGLEWRQTDDLAALRDRLRQVVTVAMGHASRECAPFEDWQVTDFEVITSHIEEAMREYWPDRAWFVEVHGGDAWVQIFQPYGVPRNP